MSITSAASADRRDTIDLQYLREWIGRPHDDRDEARPRQAALMNATVDRADPAPDFGDPLPPLWHWLYFPEALPASRLGPDGHTARGGFLPPVPLRNRLWAGGRVRFDAVIPMGATMDKRSQVIAVDHKRGRAGDLVFVTVLHEISVGGTCCIREEHDIAYRDPVAPGMSAAIADEWTGGGPSRRWTPDMVQLFRYSALTFNSTRAHYDLDYIRDVEGYRSVLVHGPLSATFLADLCAEALDAPLLTFDYQARSPFLLGDSVVLQARVDPDGMRVQVRSLLDDGRIAMQATGTRRS